MPILWPLKVPERGNAKTQRKTLEIEHPCLFIHHTIWIYPFPHLILFNTLKKFLHKSSHPSQIFIPKKILESKISSPKKSFDHPCHLKSRVPPLGIIASTLGNNLILIMEKVSTLSGLSLRAGGWGFPPANRELKQQWWQLQQEQQKSNRFKLAKQRLCTCIKVFLYISLQPLQHENALFHDLWRMGTQFFSRTSIQSFRIQLQNNLPTSDKLNEIDKVQWS